MGTVVTGDKLVAFTEQLSEIERQLRQSGGYPFDPNALKIALQNVIKGKFGASTKTGTKNANLFRLHKNGKSMWVNLDVSPRPPFPGMVAHEDNHSKAWVEIELRNDHLYINGSRVTHHLEMMQKEKTSVSGYRLRKALASKLTLHPNILDALMEHRRFIPQSWKQDEYNRPPILYFWSVEFSDTDGARYVRSLNWGGSFWSEGFVNLESHFGTQHRALTIGGLKP
jgi:hypothetical protein